MTPETYRIPNARAGDLGRTNWGPRLLFVLLCGCTLVFVTQQLAWRWQYQPALGPSYAGFYAPWRCFLWVILFTRSAAARPACYLGLGELAAGFVLAAVVSNALTARANRKTNEGAEDLHGSARFATDKEIGESEYVRHTSGFYLGAYEPAPGELRYLRDNTDEMVLCFAPTGSGKTAAVVIPNLLENADHSMIVSDPKGELHQKTSGWRSKHNDIYKFEPVGETGSRYNIFSEVRLGTDRDVADAQNIANTMCHVPGKEAIDPHWDDISESLVTGLILHALYKAKAQARPPATGADIALLLTPLGEKRRYVDCCLRCGRRDHATPDCSEPAPTIDPHEMVPLTFVDTLEEMMTFSHDPDGILYRWTIPDADGNPVPSLTHPVVKEKALEMLNRVTQEGPNNEFSGALSTAKRRFQLYADPLIRRNTAHSDFTIDALVNGPRPATLYIVIPLSDQRRLAPLVRVLITQIFNRLTESERVTRPNRWPLDLILEEFPIYGRMEILSERLPLIRGYGLRCFLIAQSTEQIIDAYGEHQSIMNNCTRKIAFTPADGKTALELETLTGERTVVQATSSFSGRLRSVTKENVSTQLNYIKRPLMTAEEIRRLRTARKRDRIVEYPGDALIFIAGQRPILGRQMFYFFDPVFRERAAIPEVTQWSRC